MGFFDKYPNTDFHEINMDWILAKIQALKDRVKGLEDAIHDIVVVTPNNGKLTIKRNNTIIGDFTADQATDEDINIAVPENTSDLNNDSDFITSSDLPDMDNYYDKTETDNLLSDKADISSLATVATTGDYDDLINKPTIPAAQVNSDWNANSGVAEILNKPALATVATSGSYTDLINKPTILSITKHFLRGITSANGNISLQGLGLDTEHNLIIAVTGRYHNDNSQLAVCIPYQYSSAGYGYLNGIHVISEYAAGGVVVNTDLDLVVYTLPI